MFFHSLDTENYFIACKNKFGHRNNYFQNYGHSGRHWAICFANHLPVITLNSASAFPLFPVIVNYFVLYQDLENS